MAKVAVIADTHFGARNESPFLLDLMERFFTECFFPELDKRNIPVILHLGDTFDKRKTINFHILERAKRFYFEPIRRGGLIHQFVLVGNHDTYYKDTNRLNAMQELIAPILGYGSRMDVFNRPEQVRVMDTQVLFLPWITAENREETMKAIADSTARICVGHLEMNGFRMAKTEKCNHGLDANIFDKFELVLSGHFHHRQTDTDIKYVGSPYAMNWDDYGDRRGFHILDTETLEMEFIENPFSAFNKIVVTDENLAEVISNVDALDGSYVKLNIQAKGDNILLESLKDKLGKMNLADLGITDETVQTRIELSDDPLAVEDTQTILANTIDTMDDLQVNRAKLKTLVLDLYKEAQALET